jgi:two-component system nitrate/nitrite response regulator NarL
VDFNEQLSKREVQVLRLLNSRLSVPEIAEEIHLSPTTVRTHVQNIYQKLNVHGRIEALQRATELGLL